MNLIGLSIQFCDANCHLQHTCARLREGPDYPPPLSAKISGLSPPVKTQVKTPIPPLSNPRSRHIPPSQRR